ncbi:hypothetical protein [Marinigracilibium pacificum]|uniref:Uncharacterized protein n=1 Tax=Marinigracilibium pacificum TaxID=2729599 RepID=A0A848J046_9BACT|nr:hypothetical protein [Marinigracilibium pacificum]NMM48895.1 hypothetical protein [Marinigracilibium pacificum]
MLYTIVSLQLAIKKVVNGVLSLGKWRDGPTPEDRLAYAIRILLDEDNYHVGIIDKKESL